MFFKNSSWFLLLVISGSYTIAVEEPATIDQQPIRNEETLSSIQQSLPDIKEQSDANNNDPDVVRGIILGIPNLAEILAHKFGVPPTRHPHERPTHGHPDGHHPTHGHRPTDRPKPTHRPWPTPHPWQGHPWHSPHKPSFPVMPWPWGWPGHRPWRPHGHGGDGDDNGDSGDDGDGDGSDDGDGGDDGGEREDGDKDWPTPPWYGPSYRPPPYNYPYYPNYNLYSSPYYNPYFYPYYPYWREGDRIKPQKPVRKQSQSVPYPIQRDDYSLLVNEDPSASMLTTFDNTNIGQKRSLVNFMDGYYTNWFF